MRNSNGYGTIVCLDKTGKKRKNPWAVRVTIGYENGSQKTKYIGYYATRSDAQMALAKFHANQMSVDSASITFGELFDLWKRKRVDTLTEKNLAAYSAVYRLTPQLHDRKLKDIKSVQLQEAMDSVDRKHATKSKLKSLWHQMYELAISDDLVLRDYSESVELNCVQEASGVVFTKEQISELWSIAELDDMAVYTLLLVYTGMRISEALQLNPATDIHLEDGYIEVHGTKTSAADRIVPIHSDIKRLLKCRENAYWLFSNSRGQKAQYRTFAMAYTKWMEKRGWCHIIHDTRKTFVTVLHENGLLTEDIAAMVGHSTQGVTSKVYMKSNVNNLISKMRLVKFV